MVHPILRIRGRPDRQQILNKETDVESLHPPEITPSCPRGACITRRALASFRYRAG
jgi:hypothetical protein